MLDPLLAGAWWIVRVLVVFLASTVAFDVVHWLLHRFMESRRAPLRALGSLHATHHRFLDRRLVIHAELIGRNIAHHVIPEYLTQVGFTLCLLWWLPASVVWAVMALQTLVVALILRARGLDVNHRGATSVKAPEPWIFCMPPYHALHHVHPDAHFSSWIKLLDFLLGTGSCVRGRRFAVTGAGAASRALARRLRERGAVAVAEIDADVAGAPDLRSLDVLVLAHEARAGSPEEAWIEAFCAAAAGRLLPPEVWTLGSGRGEARRWYADARVVYRRIAAPGEADAERRADRVIGGALRGLHAVRA